MNISRPNKYKKSRAQAMVEFALALPILLTLLYGLLETGRLLFIYASTVTAARQAARYGSATGNGPNGVPYYQDCDGIEGAARNVGFINTFEEINISYDAGLDSDDGSSLPLNPADPDCGVYTSPANGDRIIVEVSALWQPIVPIVPLEPFEIRSQSERTILASVSISVTAVPGYWEGSQNGNLALNSVECSPLLYTTLGETINYTYTLENTGTGELAGPFSITDTIAATSCSGVPDPLPAGAVATCNGTYQITQADLDNGSVMSTAIALANGIAFPPSKDCTITADPQPALELSKSASPTAASALGTNIHYTYTIQNAGNVGLLGPFSVTDNKIATVDCSGATSPLAPGDSTACFADYQITDNDINNGSVINQAVASATYNAQVYQSNTATETVYTTKLVLLISTSPTTVTLPNQVITYTYTILNNSGLPVDSLSVTDSKVAAVSCPSTTIAAGDSIDCTGTYPVSQAEYDTGGSIVNTATATANNGSSVSSNIATASVAITQTAALSATVSGSPSEPVSPATTIPAGTNIDYTYVLTNTGNVTLSSPFSVTDNKITITCSDQSSLNPGQTKNCTGTYQVTTADVDAGSIVNTGTASAVFGAQTVTSSPASETVITYSDARFSLGLTADPTVITQSGTTITFTYTITNTGGKPLTSPYSITSSIPSIGTFSCAGTSPLVSGASTFCQNTYTTSNTVTNTITAASAMDGAVSVPSSTLPSVTVSSNICSTGTLTLSAPVYSGNTVTWTIDNNVGSILNIDSISVNWNTQGNRYLSSIQLPSGTTIWSGSDKDGFATLPILPAYPGPWAINIGATTLKMVFTQNNITVTDMNLTFDEIGCGPLNNP